MFQEFLASIFFNGDSYVIQMKSLNRLLSAVDAAFGSLLLERLKGHYTNLTRVSLLDSCTLASESHGPVTDFSSWTMSSSVAGA